MKWISVKEHGLPEPDTSKTYLVYFESGVYGYGTYEHTSSAVWNDKRTELVGYEVHKECKWYLDYDNNGMADQIVYYMLIEDPEEEE